MLEVYRTYLKSTLNVNISHGSLAVLDDELLGEFFQMGDCSKPPRFLARVNIKEQMRQLNSFAHNRIGDSSFCCC